MQPPPAENEVLKRAGLIMAMTAWETFVEDRLQEFATLRIAGLSDSSIGTFVHAKLDDEIKRLQNPSSEKSLQLFSDFAGIDLAEHWTWNNYPPKLVREKLNKYMKLRGNVVHTLNRWVFFWLCSSQHQMPNFRLCRPHADLNVIAKPG